MNDTVVIFDRVRENLRKYSDIKIYELTNISINETLSRTLITSITTLLALLSIFFFGGEILKGFSLAMIFGVIFGTYSSIYIANTILVRLNVSQKTILKEEKKININFEQLPLLVALVMIKKYLFLKITLLFLQILLLVLDHNQQYLKLFFDLAKLQTKH